MFRFQTYLNSETPKKSPLWYEHRLLADFNRRRLSPELPQRNWREKFSEDIDFLYMEKEMLEFERRSILPQMKDVPTNIAEFIPWLTGSKKADLEFFEWLSGESKHDQLKWYLLQEEASDGLGRLGAPLEKQIQDPHYKSLPLQEIITEALAVGNIRLGMSLNPSYAFHAIGAHAVDELIAAERVKKVCTALRRHDAHSEANNYACLHEKSGNSDFLPRLPANQPQVYHAIAEGALMRRHALNRCHTSYKNYFNENTNYIH